MNADASAISPLFSNPMKGKWYMHFNQENIHELYCSLCMLNVTLIALIHYNIMEHMTKQISMVFLSLQQVLDFLSNLIKSFGNNFEFIVKPTLHDGMHVGVSWRIGMPYTFFLVMVLSLCRCVEF